MATNSMFIAIPLKKYSNPYDQPNRLLNALNRISTKVRFGLVYRYTQELGWNPADIYILHCVGNVSKGRNLSDQLTSNQIKRIKDILEKHTIDEIDMKRLRIETGKELLQSYKKPTRKKQKA